MPSLPSSTSWDHEHSPNSQALIPTPRKVHYIATRLPLIPHKSLGQVPALMRTEYLWEKHL